MSLSSDARDLLTTLIIGSSLLWEMMLWLSVSVILKNKAAVDTQKGTSLGVKCVRMRLAAGLRPDPLGKLERSPIPFPSHQPWDGNGMGMGVKTWELEKRQTTLSPATVNSLLFLHSNME